MTRKLTLFAVLVAAATLTVSAFYNRTGDAAPDVTTAAVSRGSIVREISATGTLEAMTTVQVGSQVSGAIESLHADFNSIVKKGQLLARLDQSLYRSAIEQARANLVRAEADHERTRVGLADAESKLARSRELAARQLIPANELDAAEVAVATTVAQLRSSQAGVTQARASLEQAQVNLAKTVITAPIDGIVISRNVDVGQTVAASLSAPTLYLIAADLAEMQLNASIDESDLGAIAPGQPVTFEVDAHPDDTFAGVVKQVRLNPVVTSNVVTYAAIITAPNPGLKLLPGMTARLIVETDRKDDVLRVPAAALRLRPTPEQLEARNGSAEDAVPGRTRVWLLDETGLRGVNVQTGATDGAWTEIVDPPFAEGAAVVTRIVAAAGAAAGAQGGATGNPLLATPGRR
jgi:HlyD family secretion protein